MLNTTLNFNSFSSNLYARAAKKGPEASRNPSNVQSETNSYQIFLKEAEAYHVLRISVLAFHITCTFCLCQCVRSK